MQVRYQLGLILANIKGSCYHGRCFWNRITVESEMYQLILVLHVLVAMGIVGLVLLQHGKGADIGAGFGSGASNTVFGSRGTGNFLFKFTGSLVIVFFVTSLTLSSMVAGQYKKSKSITQQLPAKQQPQIPIPQQ